LSKYALVPDGFTLKKVSKGEEDALKDHRKHDDLLALLNNENTPILIAGVITAVLVPVVAKQIAEDLGADESVVIESVKTAFYEGTLLGKATQFAQDLDLSKLRGWKFGGLA